MNEERLKIVLVDIIDSIEARPVSEDKLTNEFNRVQLRMFKRMLQDVCLSTDMNYSEETEDILSTWSESSQDESCRSYYFMRYIYNLSDKKGYQLN